MSEAVTGFTAGIFHQEFENVSFSIKKPINLETRVMAIIGIFGCIAILFSVIITYYTLELPTEIIKTYVALLVLVMGIIGIIRLKKRESHYRPNMLLFFSFLAGLNKGIGAGGYGPVELMGQIFSGIYEKTATAIASFSEGFVSVVGILAFLFISYQGIAIDYMLLPSIFTGGFFAAILSPYLVRVIPNRFWQVVIPVYAIGMAILALSSIYL